MVVSQAEGLDAVHRLAALLPQYPVDDDILFCLVSQALRVFGKLAFLWCLVEEALPYKALKIFWLYWIQYILVVCLAMPDILQVHLFVEMSAMVPYFCLVVGYVAVVGKFEGDGSLFLCEYLHSEFDFLFGFTIMRFAVSGCRKVRLPEFKFRFQIMVLHRFSVFVFRILISFFFE